MMTPVILARADTPDGELVLRRREDVLELIVNGVFAMDSAEVTSELVLADAAGSPPGRVLVGGLGLGYTAARLLAGGATAIEVVERAAPLLQWARDGVTDQLGALARDPRCRLVHADIVDRLVEAGDRYDAILLDVDNGPSFLIHADNARVYSPDFLASCAGRLAPGGRLVVWCESTSPALAAAMAACLDGVEELPVPVRREGRDFTYALYRGRRRH
jgi:spermidine synthase